MSEPSVLLVHPPVVRPCEPPPGLSRLAGALNRKGRRCRIVDANLEGLLHLLGKPVAVEDTWTRRAAAGVTQNLNALRNPKTYANLGRYRQAVFALNRVLMKQGEQAHVTLSLANYQDPVLSPVNSNDLKSMFYSPEKTPFYGYYMKRFAEVLTTQRFEIIGVSINFLSQALCAFALIGVLKRLDSTLRVMVGGGLITSWMKRPGWENPFSPIIDTLVCGPGEKPLLNALGIQHDGEPERPAFKDFPMNAYLSPGRVIPFSASTGCYWRKCLFCPEQAEKNRYRPLPRAETIDQLTYLVGRYEPSLVHLTDNAVSPALLNAIIQRPIAAPWYGFVRITKLLANLDFCVALRRSGCAMLQIGLESGSQRVLNAFGKGIELAVAKQALRCLKSAGIATYVYLLFGTPWETQEDAAKTLDFIVTNHVSISFLNLAVFNLPVKVPNADLLNPTPLDDGDLFLYRRFDHPAGWDRRQVRRFLDKKFKRHPLIAPIIRRDPPVFTSNHAPLIITADS